jgi:hypothetical protein
MRLHRVLGILLLAGSMSSVSAHAQSDELPGVAATAMAGPNTSTTADFYVATNGNDSWSGSLTQPFRTVDHARVAVQALKAHVSGRTIRVLIRAGTYYLPSTWTFSGQDSGTAATPILYANYPGEAPVISGGQPITGWVATSSSEWQTTLPSGMYFTQLWVNGVRRYRPRTTPNGYLYITGEYSTTGSTTTVNELSYQTKAYLGVPPAISNLSDVELIDFEAWDVPHLRVASVDTRNQRIVTTAALTRQTMFLGFIPGHRFLLENVKESLRVPGEFYLDRPTHVLTYLPTSGQSITSTSFVAPHLQKIVYANGLSYVTFQGLTFAHSDYQVSSSGYLGGQADNGTPAAITISNATGVVFESDTVEHTGAYGIEFQGHGIVGASPYLAQFRDGLITDTGAGGIRVGTQGVCSGANTHTDANVPQYVYVGNNLITGGGRVFPAGYAVLVGDAHHVLVEHNEISDFYNNGVAVGFNWGWACNYAHDDVVRFNYIHNLGQGVTSDLGAVYYLSGANSGNAILNNRVHDIVHDPNGGYGGWGLYVDAGAAGVLVENNLVYRTTDASLHLNAWNTPPPSPVQPDVFKNNILAYGRMGAMDRHNDTNFLNVVFENNIFYYDKNTGDANSVQYGYWYCQGKTVCTGYFQFNDNIYFDKAASGGEPAQPFFKTPLFPMNGGQQPPITPLTFKQWQAQGEDTGSLFADPLFVNPAPGADDFRLQSNSPAHSVGFVNFDAGQAGRLSTATLQAPAHAPGYPPQIPAITSF